MRLMAALTSAGIRTPLSKDRVTFALSPSSAMDCTEPTGTSANCTSAPLERSPTSEKTAVAVRCSRRRTRNSRPGPRPARPGRAPRPVAGATPSACGIRTTPPRRASSPTAGHGAQASGCAGPEAREATRTQRGRSESGGVVRGRASDGQCRRGLARSCVAWLDSKPPSPSSTSSSHSSRPRARTRTGVRFVGQPRTAPRRPHVVVVVVVGFGTVVVVVVPWSKPVRSVRVWARRASSVPPWRPARRWRSGSDLAAGGTGRCRRRSPLRQGVEDGRDVVEQRVENPDDGSPHWFRVAITAAERPLEWLATMRRQMPASRSRSSPAT